MLSAVPVLHSRCLLAEGPLWEEKHQYLYFTDLEGKKLHLFDPEGGRHEQVSLPFRVGTFAFYQGSQAMILAGEDGFYRYEWGGTPELLSKIPDIREHFRFNDGKCDPKGRFVAGYMDTTQAPNGRQYSFDGNKPIELFRGIGVPNGLAWTADAKTMYYADTPTGTIFAYHYDVSTGAVSDPRPVVRTLPGEGGPDGFTIDVNGDLWVAQWDGRRVVHYDPRTGEKLDEILIPATFVSSCIFGGEDYRDLYITTARGENEPEDSLSGDIFCVRLPVAGLPSFRFRF